MSDEQKPKDHSDSAGLSAIESRPGIRALINLRDTAQLGDSVSVTPLDEVSSSVPQKTGKYKIVGEIARGGVGVVLKAIDEEMGREIAIKFLHQPLRERQSIVNRFIAEAQISGQLQHPGVIPTYDMGLAEGTPFFTMKLVKGRTLASLLDERPDHNTHRRRFISIFHQVCMTMGYAHARGVIHRDLKPANVMVGAFGEVLVVDWGMGKVLSGTSSQKEEDVPDEREFDQTIIHTHRDGAAGDDSLVGSILGTPRYMPPEQAMGAVDDMDERSDVFALGAILTELLTGQPPYVASRADLLPMVASADLEPAKERLRECGADPELIDIALDCLNPKPSGRPRHAGIIAERVGQWLSAADDQIQEARFKASSFKKTRNIALAGSLVVLGAFAAAILFWMQARRDHDTAELATRAAQVAEGKANSALADAEAARQGAESARDEAESARTQAEESRDEARNQHKRAEDESRKAVAVTRFMADMLALADPLVSGDADPTLRTLLERAAVRVGKDLAGDEAAEARIRTTIGEAYLSLGDMEHASAQLRRAVDLHERAANRKLDQLYRAVRGVLFVVRGGFGEDVEHWKQRYEALMPEVLAAHDPELANQVNEVLVEVRGSGPLDRAARLIPEIGAYEFVADTSGAEADPSAARLGVRDVLVQCAHRILDPGNPRRGGWGLPRRRALAEKCWKQALRICREVLPAGHPETISTAEELSRLLNQLGRTDEAVAVARSAADEIRNSVAKDHWRVAHLDAWLAALYLQQDGEKSGEAEALLRKSHTRLVAHFGAETRETHEILARLASIYVKSGQDAELADVRERLLAFAITSPDSDLWTRVAPFLPEEYRPLEAARQALLACEQRPEKERAAAAMDKILDLLDLREELLKDPRNSYAAVLARWMVWAADNHKDWLNRAGRQELTGDAVAVLRAWQQEAPLALAYLWLERSSELVLPAERGMREGALGRAYNLYRKHLDGDDEKDTRWHTLLARARLGELRIEQGNREEARKLLEPAVEGLLAIEGEGTSWNATRFRQVLIELLLDMGAVKSARQHALRHAASPLDVQVMSALRVIDAEAPEVFRAFDAVGKAMARADAEKLPQLWSKLEKASTAKLAGNKELQLLYADALDGLSGLAEKLPPRVVLPYQRSLLQLRRTLHPLQHAKVGAAHAAFERCTIRAAGELVKARQFQDAEKLLSEGLDGHLERTGNLAAAGTLVAALLDLYLAWGEPKRAAAKLLPNLHYPLHRSTEAAWEIARRKGLEAVLYKRVLSIFQETYGGGQWTEIASYYAARTSYWLQRYDDCLRNLSRSGISWSPTGQRYSKVLRALAYKRKGDDEEAAKLHAAWKKDMGFREVEDKQIETELEELFPSADR